MAERLADALQLADPERERFLAAAVSGVAPRARDRPAPTIPVPLTPMLGRLDELDELVALLVVDVPPSRLVTLTGPPGVGKTRLALEVARRAHRALSGRSLWVPLSSVTAPDGLIGQIAAAVDLPAAPGVDVSDLLGRWIDRGPALVVLDNFEQLLPAAQSVQRMLLGSEHLRVLATSRVPLELSGELEYPLEPLALPSAGSDPFDSPAIDLFRARARAAGRGASVDSDPEAIAEICCQLDGLPLAIELAAGRIRELTLAELSAQLRAVPEGLAILRSRAQDRESRHRTMADALRWSIDALDTHLREVLVVASVFPGPFTAQSLSDIAEKDVDPLDPLRTLCRHALVQRGADGRFVVLQLVRSFVLDSIGHDAVRALRARHALWVAAELEEVDPGLDAWPERHQLDRVRALEVDALAALQWCFEPGGDPSTGERCIAGLAPLWMFAGRWSDLDRWSTRSVAALDDAAHRIASTYLRGALAWSRHDVEGATVALRAVAGTSPAGSDPRWRLEALGQLAMCELMAGRAVAALELLRECDTAYETLGDDEGRAFTAIRRVWLALAGGDLAGASEAVDLATACYERTGSGWGQATATGMRAEVLLRQGLFDAAICAFVDSLSGMVEIGAEWFAVPRLAGIANALCADGRAVEAATACGMVDAWLDELGAPLFPLAVHAFDMTRSATAAVLGSEFEVAVAEGRTADRSLAGLAAWLGARCIADRYP
jgi:predicted ATPase